MELSGSLVGYPVSQISDAMAHGNRDMRFQHTSSSGDSDVSEPSFMDMLRSNNTKKTVAASEAQTTGASSEPSDGTQGGRSAKKKGKRGRQIDPSLLGFKVTSNRIMMGEIQRLDD